MALPYNELLTIYKEVALGQESTIISEEALAERKEIEEYKKMVEGHGGYLEIPFEIPEVKTNDSAEENEFKELTGDSELSKLPDSEFQKLRDEKALMYNETFGPVFGDRVVGESFFIFTGTSKGKDGWVHGIKTADGYLKKTNGGNIIGVSQWTKTKDALNLNVDKERKSLQYQNKSMDPKQLHDLFRNFTPANSDLVRRELQNAYKELNQKDFQEW